MDIGRISASTVKTLAAGGSGALKLDGKVSALSAAQTLLNGDAGAVRIEPTGFMKTPYGKIKLSNFLEAR
jgi:hypothetical protein